jgi:hypothetical protein
MHKKKIFTAIATELDRADGKYPPMNGPVEGLHTLKCEVAELEREVMREHKDHAALMQEAVQVGAMAVKFLRDCCMSQERSVGVCQGWDSSTTEKQRDGMCRAKNADIQKCAKSVGGSSVITTMAQLTR